MADSTLSSLTAAAALDGDELFYAIQGGADRKVTADQIATFAGGGGGVGGVSHPGYIAGNWYHQLMGAVLTSGEALPANTIRFVPVILFDDITISELGSRVATVAASQNVQFAIYARSNSTGKPTGSALGSTGNISTASAAAVSAALSANAVLTAGTYFFATNSSGGSPIFTSVASTSSTIGAIVGSSSISNLMASSGTGMVTYSLGSQTFGTWPSVTGQTFTESNASSFPFLAFKVASIP